MVFYNVCTLQNNIFSGLFVGQNLVTLKQVDSTNNYLKKILSNSEPLPEGTVIMAEEQYAGRGQYKNGWFAEKGNNLTISILLKPLFLPLNDQFQLTQVVSIATVKALKQTSGLSYQIKWPNDIYYGEKKLGGILIENSVQGKRINNSVIGIGLNVNQPQFPENLPRAVSLKQILQRDYDLKAVLSEICRHIEAWYLKLKAGKTDEINIAYLDRLLGLNEERRYRSEEETYRGVIKGVDHSGLLEIQTNGIIKKYNLKEVEFLFD
nr:biotin--[acetyl-CoA-carboxylase] ligase [Mucilaginibacter straminoryzae]